MSIHVIYVNRSRVPEIFTFFHLPSFFTVLFDSLPSFSYNDISFRTKKVLHSAKEGSTD